MVWCDNCGSKRRSRYIRVFVIGDSTYFYCNTKCRLQKWIGSEAWPNGDVVARGDGVAGRITCVPVEVVVEEDDKMAQTPELDKLFKVKEQSQACSEFLAWLQHTKKIILAERHTHDNSCGSPLSERADLFAELSRRDSILGQYRDVCGLADHGLYEYAYSIERLLAEFFEIDLNKAEEERRGILRRLQQDTERREKK
jgi:hypothetical protein